MTNFFTVSTKTKVDTERLAACIGEASAAFEGYDYARALWFEEFIDSGMMPFAGPQVFRPLVLGPIAIGYGAHQGLGQFIAIR